MTVSAPTAALADARLAPVIAFAQAWRPRIESTLTRCLATGTDGCDRLAAAAGDAVGLGTGGGHRWRPLLTLAAIEAFGADPADGLVAAAAVELTHTASLVLDDLPCMDDSPLRRGRPSTHVQVGTAGAILVAVGLLGRAAELLGSDPRTGGDAARVWGQVVGLDGMAGGQGVDIAAPARLAGAARRLHRRKTTALAAFSLGLGAGVAGAPPAARLALERFGRDLGWAYQVADDAADVQEDRLAGRHTRPAQALRTIRWLMARATTGVEQAPGLTPRGRDLLLGFGQSLLALVTPNLVTRC